MKVLFMMILFVSQYSYAQKSNVKYEYKKYEKFDLGTMDIGGSKGSPGDLSISPRFRKKFKNKIPQRYNFNKEMLKAIDTVK